MLDQNTDRMWYVIGAVIVGAAIIFLANGTLPSLFASVSESFEEATEGATDVVADISPQTRDHTYLTTDDIRPTTGDIVGYDAASNTWHIKVHSVTDTVWHAFGGLRIASGRRILPYGKTATMTYDILVEDNIPNLRTTVDINTLPYDTDVEPWLSNDNDDRLKRSINGQESHVTSVGITAGEWHTIEATYANTSPMNTEQVDLSTTSRMGVQNTTGHPIDIYIRDVRIVVR